MQFCFRRCCFAAAIGALSWGNLAHAAVNLSLTDNDTTPNYFVLRPVTANSSIMPTGSFVTLNLSSSGDAVTGVGYRFEATGPLANVVRYTNRELAGSSYPDPTLDDVTVETVAASTMNPQSDLDLGSSVTDVMSPTLQGTFMVARYVFSVANYTPGAVYTINTFSDNNAGIAGGPPDFADGSFSGHGSFKLVMPLRGDANRDLVINNLDFNILFNNFSKTATGRNWDQGDFNLDGRVNFLDFQILETAYGQTLPAPADIPLPGNQVPEPLALGSLAFAALLLTRRSRR
jgi:hypothetical protein